jgi:hypothetical protein
MQASERVTERSIPHNDIAGSKEILNNGTGQTENTCELDRLGSRPLNKKINFGKRKKRTNSILSHLASQILVQGINGAPRCLELIILAVNINSNGKSTSCCRHMCLPVRDVMTGTGRDTYRCPVVFSSLRSIQCCFTYVLHIFKNDVPKIISISDIFTGMLDLNFSQR